MIFTDNSLSIGRTPLVRLNRVLDGAPVTLLAKVEGRNPSYSVKCRIGASMIWDAEKRGILTPGKELIEPTSGNTGIALAFVGAARGYKVTLLMPETMSVERRKVLKALGARLILTDGSEGMQASIERAEQMVAEDPDRFVLLQQFQNPANPEIGKTPGAMSMFSWRASARVEPSRASRDTSSWSARRRSFPSPWNRRAAR
jgi:cysteine synthase A